jgi:C-terminal peptidase prc
MSRHSILTVAAGVLIASGVIIPISSNPASLSQAMQRSMAASPQEEAASALSSNSGASAEGVRICAYAPDMSKVATMSPEALDSSVPTAQRTTPLFVHTAVPREKTERQMRLFSAVQRAVTDLYVYQDFRGKDWPEIGKRYGALVEGGLSDDDFYLAMQRMIAELGDEHSHFQSPGEVTEEKAKLTAGEHFVGIGILGFPIPGTQTGSIITVWPGSPAAAAGLRPHDALLEVDGLPYREESGPARSLGPDGSRFTLKYRRPGQAPQTATLTRRAVAGFIPIDFCLLPEARIGYVLLPTFMESNLPEQVRDALRRMTVGGPLRGLIIDDRVNGGGRGSVALSVLGLFTKGPQGRTVSRSNEREFVVQPEDVGGSQTVPLVVLTDRGTMSYAEIFAGVLQRSGRAKIVGGRTAGRVEVLHAVDFADGSRLWLAAETFAPVGLAPGTWENGGVVPDVSVPTRWDLFSEATDPAFARAVSLLTKK